MKEINGLGGHGGNVQAAAAKFGLSLQEIIDFSSNVNPTGPLPGLLRELSSHINEINCYPAPQAAPLRRALAGYLQVAEERLLMGNGANELIHLLFLWLRPRKALIPAPAFSEYARAAFLAGAAIERFPLPPEKPLEVERLLKNLEGVSSLVFCNPNNPTGMFYPREVLEEIIREAAKKKVTVILDESFFPLTGKPWEQSFSTSQYDNLWVITSLTKLWALPGLRLGYLIGPVKEVKKLTENGDPWRVNALAQRAGLYCLAAKNKNRQRSIDLIRAERAFLIGQLQGIAGIKVFQGEANFLLLRGETKSFTNTDLYRALATRGILIRDASNFCGLDHRYFRIAVRQRQDNLRLLQELRNYFCK